MLIVAVIATSSAAMLFGEWRVDMFLLFTLVLVTALAILACAGHGRTRVLAIGFVVSAISYGSGCWFMNHLGHQVDSSMVATWIVSPAYERIVDRQYLDGRTGKPVAQSDPIRKQRLPAGGYGGFNGAGRVTVTEMPSRQGFKVVAHVLVLLVFAYLGGKFAVLVDHWRSNAMQQEQA